MFWQQFGGFLKKDPRKFPLVFSWKILSRHGSLCTSLSNWFFIILRYLNPPCLGRVLLMMFQVLHFLHSTIWSGGLEKTNTFLFPTIAIYFLFPPRLLPGELRQEELGPDRWPAKLWPRGNTRAEQGADHWRRVQPGEKVKKNICYFVPYIDHFM